MALEKFAKLIGRIKDLAGEAIDGIKGWRKADDELRKLEKEGPNVIHVEAKSCSFSGDTEVLLADGGSKPIRDIKIGDMVRAADPETGEQGARPISALWVHQDLVVNLVTDAGSVVTATADHPFWNASDRQWQRADRLGYGDALFSVDGNVATIVGLQSATQLIDTAYSLSMTSTPITSVPEMNSSSFTMTVTMRGYTLSPTRSPVCRTSVNRATSQLDWRTM